GTVYDLEDWLRANAPANADYLRVFHGIIYQPRQGPVTEFPDTKEFQQQRDDVHKASEDRQKANRERLLRLLSHTATDGTRQASDVGKVAVGKLRSDGKLDVLSSAPANSQVEFTSEGEKRHFQVEGPDGGLHDTEIEIEQGHDDRDPVRLYSAPLRDAEG